MHDIGAFWLELSPSALGAEAGWPRCTLEERDCLASRSAKMAEKEGEELPEAGSRKEMFFSKLKNRKSWQ